MLAATTESQFLEASSSIIPNSDKNTLKKKGGKMLKGVTYSTVQAIVETEEN